MDGSSTTLNVPGFDCQTLMVDGPEVISATGLHHWTVLGAEVTPPPPCYGLETRGRQRYRHWGPAKLPRPFSRRRNGPPLEDAADFRQGPGIKSRFSTLRPLFLGVRTQGPAPIHLRPPPN